jgi:hypothetical protein
MGYKMKGFSGFKNSPAKHDKSAGGHSKKYGKHTNADHPDYWKTSEAKKLVNDNVANTTIDGGDDKPLSNKSTENIIKADSILEQAGYTLEEREQATGAEGYEAAKKWSEGKKR